MAEKPRILLVDDDEGVLKVLGQMLEGRGYGVMAVSEAAKALTLAEKGCFAAVLLDNAMPGMTGMEALPRLAALTRAPILLMTGRVDEEVRKDALLLGAKAVLAKPLGAEELDEALRAAIAG